MRRSVLLVAISVWLLVATATPANACSRPGPLFTVSRSSGGPGTEIQVHTYCSQGGGAVLRFPVRSHALQPPIDAGSFPSGEGPHTVTLHNKHAPRLAPGAPYLFDLEVGFVCGDVHSATPFFATDNTTAEEPRVFTTPGDGWCGSAGIACRPNLRGFSATGAVNYNWYAKVDGRGGSVAVHSNEYGDSYAIGSGPDAPARFEWADVSYDAYPEFRGGVNVAAGDLDGDGYDEIVTAPGPGGGPHIKVWSLYRPPPPPPGQPTIPGCGPTLYNSSAFMAYDEGFAGGVNVAVADVSGDGRAEIVTGAGPGGGPHVRVFDKAGGLWHEFMAYDAAFHGGVSVAAADVSPGDIGGEIVTGAGPGGGPHVRTFTATGRGLSGFYAYAPDFTGGVHVAAGHAVDDTTVNIVTGPGAGGGPHVRVLDANGNGVGGFYAYQPNIASGVRVAAAP